jgi:2-oxo-4-hydroxy-4-carboxy-5-ureidoimidazoline decarboxylase
LPDPHAVINAACAQDAAQTLARCCGARRWVAAMLARRPFPSTPDLHAAAQEELAWGRLGREDWLEAFSHHPAIGAPRVADRWASQEQAGVAAAETGTVAALARANAAYAARFGHIFIVCATGKSAAEMLDLLQARLGNDPETELRIAAAEQAKITHLRLDKLG